MITTEDHKNFKVALKAAQDLGAVKVGDFYAKHGPRFSPQYSLIFSHFFDVAGLEIGYFTWGMSVFEKPPYLHIFETRRNWSLEFLASLRFREII